MTKETAIKVPDIGGATGVDVIELLVKVGDHIDVESPLITLESDKASMEIPSPVAGTVRAMNVKLGDKVAEGDVILMVVVDSADEESASAQASVKTAEAPVKAPEPEENSTPVIPEKEKLQAPRSETNAARQDTEQSTLTFASPSVRRLARVLGVNLSGVRGTGRKERISKEDVEQFVKTKLGEKSTGLSMPTAPVIDFSRLATLA